MTDMHVLALQLMAVQAGMGAFDTLYHHEGTEALAQRDTAGRELAIHAVRSSLYALLFIGLSGWAWHGLWAWCLMAIFTVEIVLTLWDFVVEDHTRLLPATERVTHTVLAVNGGAIVALLGLTANAWAALPTAMVWQPQGWLGGWLALCGVGVGLSAVRDARAARQLLKRVAAGVAHPAPAVRFGRRQVQRVLVTGGTGFIGRILVHHLLADGHSVTVLSRNARAAAWSFGGQVRCVRHLADMSAAEDFDVVVNLAGAPILGPRWTPARKQYLLRTRADFTRELGRWIAQRPRPPWLLLSASAIGYYGVTPLGDPADLTESAPPQAIFMSQLCQEWEQAAWSCRRPGTNVACCRMGVVLGHQGALPRMLLPIALGGGGPLGSGAQWLSWIHVQDVVRAFAHVWSAEETRAAHCPLVEEAGEPSPATVNVYNFTAPYALTQGAFAREAARQMRRPFWMPAPAWAARLALGEQADLLLEGQRVVPKRLMNEGFQFTFPRAEAALADLLHGSRSAD